MADLNTKELLKTIYYGDRWIKRTTYVTQDKTLRFQFDCISRVRSKDGKWDYYNDENIDDGELIFEGVDNLVYTPSGFTINDAIHDIECSELDNGAYKITVQGDFNDNQSLELTYVTIELTCDSAYLIDQKYPNIKIRN